MDASLLPSDQPTRVVARSKLFPLWPLQKYNRNVVLTWISGAFEGAGDSIWNTTVLPALIYEVMGKSNSYVGYIEAVQGLTSLIVGLPVGYVADKHSKSTVIAAGALCVPLAVAATTVAAIYGVADGVLAHTHAKTFAIVMTGAMMLWGAAYAVYGGTQQALMADSTPTNGRAWYYTKLNQLNLVASALGPCIAIGMFITHGSQWFHGDTWDLIPLRNVLLVGLAIELPMCIPMLLYRDDCAVEEAEAERRPRETSAASQPAVDAQPARDAQPLTGALPAADAQPTAAPAAPVPCHVWAVPYVLFAQDIVFAVGSGMTVKFFPLFFKNKMQLSPVGVQVIWLINPLLMAAFNSLAERLARCVGRMPVMICFKVVGISLLVTMALAKDWAAPASPANHTSTLTSLEGAVETPTADDSSSRGLDHAQLAKVVLMSAVYLLRTSLMNCTNALEEAILMDFVPKTTRARWKALQNVSAFGWCGSAALGGIIVDKFESSDRGYSTTFLITAALQLTGTVIFSVLLCVIPRRMDFEIQSEAEEKDLGGNQARARTSAASSSTHWSDAEAPHDDILVKPLVGSIQASQGSHCSSRGGSVQAP